MIIKIRGLEVQAKHGVHLFEKDNAQPFVFDADLFFDFYAAAKDDDLSKTVNYSAACTLIAQTALENTYNLIETLVYSCANRLMDTFPIDGLELTVYKPQAPVKQKFKTVGVTVKLKRERAILSLGSSLGNRKEYLDRAIRLLGETGGIEVKKVSSFLATQPYGGVAKNEFLNCAVEISTYLTPRRLLDEIHRIEAECGRTREIHWGDRTLDIDIIFFGSRIIEEDDLIIPHPEYSKRDFVLIPVKEIAPEYVCPVTHKKMKTL